MSTLTLRPNAAGSDEWTTQYPASGDFFDKVDEASPDEDTTYIETAADTNYVTQTFHIPDSGVTGTINSLKVYVRIKTVGAASCGHQIAIRAPSTLYDGDYVLHTTSYVTVDYTWSVSPVTSNAWEWSEINALQIGIRARGGSSTTTRVTQVYAEVDYTPQVDYPINSSVAIGVLVSASKSYGPVRIATVLIGNLVSAISVLTGSIRSSTVLIGNLVSATRTAAMIRTSAVLVGILVTASRIHGRDKSAAVLIGNLVAATRGLVTFTRSSNVLIGVFVTSSRLVDMLRTSSVLIGTVTTANRLAAAIRQASVSIGILLTADRVVTATRAAMISIGVVVNATRLYGKVATSSVLVGIDTIATKSWNHTITTAVSIGVDVLMWGHKSVGIIPRIALKLFERVFSFTLYEREGSFKLYDRSKSFKAKTED